LSYSSPVSARIACAEIVSISMITQKSRVIIYDTEKNFREGGTPAGNERGQKDPMSVTMHAEGFWIHHFYNYSLPRGAPCLPAGELMVDPRKSPC